MRPYSSSVTRIEPTKACNVSWISHRTIGSILPFQNIKSTRQEFRGKQTTPQTCPSVSTAMRARVICVTIAQSYNRGAIVQPRLYDCAMVTQITLKTESPHGLLSDRLPAEVDPPCGEVLLHLNRLRCGHAYHLRGVSRARTHDSMSEWTSYHSCGNSQSRAAREGDTASGTTY